VRVDFGRLGLIPDPARCTRRVVHGLIFTAVYSRHLFVFPTPRQTLEPVLMACRCPRAVGRGRPWRYHDP